MYFQGMFNLFFLVLTADGPHSPRRIPYYLWGQVSQLSGYTSSFLT